MATDVISFREAADEQFFYLYSGGEGDYERLLVSGMAGHLPRKDGLIQYERIGPFMPPMCITAGHIIITDAMYRALMTNAICEFQVKPVKRAHICRSDWDGVADLGHIWGVGEPEDQILDKPHDADCAAALGDLYELLLPVCGNWTTLKFNSEWSECEFVCPTFSGGELFALRSPAPDDTRPLCSVRCRRWLEDFGAARWIQFIPATITRQGPFGKGLDEQEGS